MRFLIILVLNKEKMSPEEYAMGSSSQDSRTEKTKKSLLELLKTDENLRQSLFGHLQAQDANMSESSKTMGMQRVSDQDKASLNRLGVSAPFHRDVKMESTLMQPNVSLELEYNDVLKAN